MKKKAVLLFSALCVTAAVSNAATINIIGDHTTQKGPDFVGASSNLGNGDFQTETTTGTRTFAQISNWFNIFGAETVNFGQSNGTAGSPQSNSLGAQLSTGAYAANNTSYTIGAAGEVFKVNMYLGQFGAAATYATDTTVTIRLFTSATGVTDTTVSGDLTNLGSLALTPFSPTAAFFGMAGGTLYTSTAADIGKTVYMGISLADTDNNAFPRIDVVSLSVVQVPEPAAALLGSLGMLALLRRRRG